MTDSPTIRHDLDDLPTRFAMATNLVQQGDLAGADEAFARIVQDIPNCHEAHFMRGRICMEGRRFDEAAKHLKKAESIDPGHPEYMLRLGQVALAQRDDTAAIHWFERAREEVEDESAELAAGYARALTMARRFQHADEAYTRACELDPDDTSLWLARASVQQRLGDLAGTEASLHRAIACAPEDPNPRAELAIMLERSNRLDEARVALDEALRLKDNHPKTLVVRARLIRREGDKAGAQRDLECAIAGMPDSDERRLAQITLAQVLDECGDYEAAYACMLESKKPIAEVGASLRQQGQEYLNYIHALHTLITPELISTWSAPPPEDRQPPVFFVGFPRSGTTLLEQMLAAHPKFVTTDEQQSLPKVRAYLRGAVSSASEIPTALGQLNDDQVCQLRSIYWQDVDAYLGALEPGVRVIDKHPLNTANLAIVRRLFPSAPVIMSLRDPRDVCVSCMTNLTRTPMAATLFHSFETTANFYAAAMGLWLHYRETLGLHFIETKYEDVIDDTEAELRRVIAFLGEKWDDEMLRFGEHAKKRAIRSPSYEQVTRALHRGAIGRWRNYEKHMGAALETLAPFVATLGYDAAAS